MTLAKGLGGGFPIGALVIGPRLADVFAPGDHGSTFAGGPLACAAANAALDVLDDEALLARVRELGERLAEGLRELPRVAEVQGPRADGGGRRRRRRAGPRAPRAARAAAGGQRHRTAHAALPAAAGGRRRRRSTTRYGASPLSSKGFGSPVFWGVGVLRRMG